MARVIAFCLLLFTASVVYAQGEKNSLKGVPVKERIVSGGGFGLGFSSEQDFFSLSPVIGYQLTRKLMAGTSLTYRFTSWKVVDPAVKLHDYGINPFARFVVYKNLFLQAEYEHLNYEFPVSYTETTREKFDSFMAGGGIFQPISEKVGFYLMALYNFSYTEPKLNEYAVYNSPLVIRAGINVGSFSF